MRAVADFTPGKFEDIRRNLDPEWILGALKATGSASIRRRRLPAEQVIWLVIGMALMRNRSIHDVVSKLDLALPGDSPSVAPSVVADARARLGDKPLEWLFAVCAEHWSHKSAAAHRWRSLALYGVDGTSVRVPDSTENIEAFGYCHRSRIKEDAYPLVRVTALMALRSHLLAKVAFGPSERGELDYASELWSSVPNNSLTIVDKGFFSASILMGLACLGKNRHWLIRSKKNIRWNVTKRLGKNELIVEMKVSPQARAKDSTLPETWRARAITCQRKGFRPQTLLTSLLEAETYPAKEVASLYHERWELELGFDEIKTEVLDREETIRSKKPNGIRQELWGIFLAYNLVRLEMERVAKQADVEPTRVSFVAALRYICDEWLWCAIASPGAIPKHLRNLRENLSTFILPKRRAERLYPRAVKNKMTRYMRKRRPISEEKATRA